MANSSEWITTELGNVATLQRGYDLPGRLRVAGEVPIISSSGTTDWHNRAMAIAPGVVTGRYGTIGQVFFAESDYWPLNTTLYVSNFHQNDPRFVYYLLQRVDFASHSGKSGVPGVNRNDLHKLHVSIPGSREEQHAVAKTLSDMDLLIDSLLRLIAKKQSIKQGMMQQLLTGKTRLPGFSGSWRDLKLGEVASMGSGGTPSSKISGFYGGGIPWVSIADMTSTGKYIQETEKTLTHDGISSSAARLYEPNVVLYAMYASLGECSIAVGRVSSSQAILGISPGRSLDREFLYYYLTSVKSIVKDMGQQGTQSNLNAGMVRNFDLRLPPLDEQLAVSAVLIDIDKELDGLTRRLELARSVKQGMMQELLTGRTRLAVEVSL